MTVAAEPVGQLLKSWRERRRRSQLDVSIAADVSARHLSFVETGRAMPSRAMIERLCDELDVPLRERNALLTAAGYAAVFRASALDSDELVHLRKAIDHVLRQQEPYGAVVVDGHWDILRINDGAARLFSHFPPATSDGAAAARNLVLGVFHPGALRPYIVNWYEIAANLVARVHREIAARPGDEQLSQLLVRVLAQPDVPTEWRVAAPGRSAPPILGVHLRSPTLEVRLFTMLTSIGTPLDVTAEEIHIESYFPADEESEAALRG